LKPHSFVISRCTGNQTFLVSEGEDVSTTELLRRMGQALGRPARLLPVPASWLKLAMAMVGKQDVEQRLCGSLQVDIKKPGVCWVERHRFRWIRSCRASLAMTKGYSEANI
jgi:hypothetical protein